MVAEELIEFVYTCCMSFLFGSWGILQSSLAEKIKKKQSFKFMWKVFAPLV